MSRNRLSELSNPYTSSDAQAYQPSGGYDLERNNLVAGERYEMQDQSGRTLTMNEFLDEINDAKEATSRLEAQITRIDQLHTDSLAVTEPAPHAELDSLVASTSSLINSIRGTLERLGSDAKKGGPDAQKKVTLVNAQRRKLQERVQHFQTIEKVYRDKVRERAIRQYKIVNPDVTEQELSTALSDPNTQIFQQALMTSTRTSQARSTLSEVQSRHNDILAIERKIQELAQLFTELGVMVELQEIPIDNIDRQADQVKTTTAEGLEQVSRATKLARAVRRKKWWCLFIILLIIAIIVIIVVVTQVVNKKTTSS